MTHVVHPKSFRLRDASDWSSRWFNKKKLREYLEEDFKIREFLKIRLKDAGVENVEIERFPGKANIIIGSARPAFIIGRGGRGAEDLKKEIEKVLGKTKDTKGQLRIEIR